MKELPFAKPAPNWVEPNANFSPITVFLSGEVEAEGQSGWCVVRSVAPGRAMLETELTLTPGDPVRVKLNGGRQLWGEVEDHEKGLMAIRFRRMPVWVLDLCGQHRAN